MSGTPMRKHFLFFFSPTQWLHDQDGRGSKITAFDMTETHIYIPGDCVVIMDGEGGTWYGLGGDVRGG